MTDKISLHNANNTDLYLISLRLYAINIYYVFFGADVSVVKCSNVSQIGITDTAKSFSQALCSVCGSKDDKRECQ